jgi:hypothetical protein
VGEGFGVQRVQFLVRELAAPLEAVGIHAGRVVASPSRDQCIGRSRTTLSAVPVTRVRALSAACQGSWATRSSVPLRVGTAVIVSRRGMPTALNIITDLYSYGMIKAAQSTGAWRTAWTST